MVIIFAPMIKKWAEKLNLPSQKFLIPLSYATILGGTCTLIGTSTNLVVHGMMLDRGIEGLGMFELAKLVYLFRFWIYLFIIFRTGFFPGEVSQRTVSPMDLREFNFDVVSPKTAALVGKKIEKRKLPGSQSLR